MPLSSLEGGHAACVGGESGGEWVHVGLWLCPFGVHLTVTAASVSCTPMQEKSNDDARKAGQGPPVFQ